MSNLKERRFVSPSRTVTHTPQSPDAAMRERVEAIARLAADHFRLPMALISAVENNCERFVTCVNVAPAETQWDHSFSAAALELNGTTMLVPDATADPRFQTNPFVAGESGVVFCCGVQLTGHDGAALGGLFLCDTERRPELTSVLADLQIFARQIAFELECPRITSDLRLFSAAANQADDAICFAEHRGPTEEPAIIYVNSSFERMTGFHFEEARGKSPIRLLFGDGCPEDTVAAIRGAIKMASPVSLETVNYRRNGNAFVADVSLSPIFDEHGICTHWISVRRDVTAHRKAVAMAAHAQARSEVQDAIEHAVAERERAEQSLKYLTFHDVLTGLPNRSLLLQGVAEHLSDGGVSSMFFIDIDRFKSVNAAFGREAGDNILAEISSRLKRSTSRSSIAARMEGDSFAVWIPGVNRSEAERTAAELLAAISAPFVVDGRPLSLHASIGLVSTDTRRYERSEDMLADADIAMYRAKRLGGNRFHAFTDDLQDHALTRLRVEVSMQRALDRQEFMLHYQPIVSVGTQKIVALEALLRWNDPERGMVPPGLFIPIAEQTGQILPIGAYVLERACSDAVQWRAHTGAAAPLVNVNISGRQLGDETLGDCVLEALQRTGLPPSALCLEITETAFVEHLDIAIETLRKLREHGVLTAMDDFGTGYSSLGYLRRFEFQQLKIDRSFISGRSGYDGIADPDIVQMIVSLGQARGMHVTAEGIETKEQLAQAQALGCRHAQGYFIQAPAPLADTRSLAAITI